MIGDAKYQPDPTMVDTQSNFKFFTGMTLLDVDGGAKIAKTDMTYPARILVMGPAGELYIRNDTDDKPYVDILPHDFRRDRPINVAIRSVRKVPGGPVPRRPPLEPASVLRCQQVEQAGSPRLCRGFSCNLAFEHRMTANPRQSRGCAVFLAPSAVHTSMRACASVSTAPILSCGATQSGLDRSLPPQ